MKNKALMLKLLFLIIIISVTTAQAQTKTTTRSGSTRYERSSGNDWMNVEADSANDPNKRLTLYRNGEVYKIKVVNEKITELYIDDKKIPEGDYPKYESMVKEILVQLKKDMEQAARDRAQANIDRKRADRDREEAEVHRQQANRDRERAEKDRQQADRDRDRAEQDRVQANKHREQAIHDRQQAELHRDQAQKDRERAEVDRQRADTDRQRAEMDRKRAEKDRARAEIDRKRAEEDRKMMEALIEDLIKEKVVADRDELRRLQLTDESLIVNDKKQSAELHQKLKAKYLKKDGGRITYHNDAGGRGIYLEKSN